MENRYELNREIKVKAEAGTRNIFAVKDYPEVRELTMTELGTIAAGGPFDPPDLNLVVCGWTGYDLYNLLCWVYTSYHDPLDKADFAKGLTIDVAYSYIPSVAWKEYRDYDYPAFIMLPIQQIWRGY